MQTQIRVDWLISQLKIIGGAEVYVKYTVPRLRNLGWDLRVITFSEGDQIADELRNAGIPLIELIAENKYDFRVVKSLFSLWKEDRPRIVHTHLYHAGIIGRFCAFPSRIYPVIVQQHGPELYRTRLRSSIDRVSSRLVTKYIVTCKAVQEVLRLRERIPSKKIKIIYNGINIPEESILSYPSEWAVPPGSISICCVGRLTEEKGQQHLVNALTKLTTKYPNIHTVFLGEGPNKKNLIELTKQYDLNSNISFVGYKSDIRKWLPFFDIFVLPSDWEGVSMALLEAMMQGLPVIASSTGGNPEIVVNNVTGFLVPPKNPDALASAIENLIINPDQRRHMGDAGRERAMKEFNINRTVLELDSFYKDLLRL